MSLKLLRQRDGIVAHLPIAILLPFALLIQLFFEDLLVKVLLVRKILPEVFEIASVVALCENQGQPGIIRGVLVGDDARVEYLGELGLLGALDDDIRLHLLLTPVELGFAALSRGKAKIAC